MRLACTLFILPLLALAACGPPIGEAEQQGACPVEAEGGWTAFVNAMPGPGPRPRLVVSGAVTAPSGGYHVRLELGAVIDGEQPVQEVLMRARPPAEAATQALETLEVRGEFPAHHPLGGVLVRCAETVVAEIRTIEVAR